ncbi:MAG: branched-chain amino acid ABC transporter permease [Devosia sp.]
MTQSRPVLMTAPSAPSYGGATVVRGRRRLAIVLGAAVMIGGLFLPGVIGSTFYLGLLTDAVILGIAAMGIGFLMHQCGLVMFGVSAFVGLPAYLIAISIKQWNFTVTSAVALAFCVTVAFALLVGCLVVRARPLPFAMLTLALAQMLKATVTLQAMQPITGGDDGMPLNFSGDFLGLSQVQLAAPASFWPVVWVALCIVTVAIFVAGRCSFGRKLRATKANDERMRFSGFDTYTPRVLAFAFSCSIVAVSGVLLALHTAYTSPESLDFVAGGSSLLAMLIGGAAAVLGPLLGAILFASTQIAFGATGHLELLTGVAVVLVIGLFPKGLAGFIERACAAAVARARRDRRAG